MKVIHKRLLAAVLTAVMLMPAASCSKGRSNYHDERGRLRGIISAPDHELFQIGGEIG